MYVIYSCECVKTYLMTQQLNPRIRYGKNSSVETNEGCSSTGMDQGFHNWLIYSGIIQKYMEVKVYQQGEGPVNTGNTTTSFVYCICLNINTTTQSIYVIHKKKLTPNFKSAHSSKVPTHYLNFHWRSGVF